MFYRFYLLEISNKIQNYSKTYFLNFNRLITVLGKIHLKSIQSKHLKNLLIHIFFNRFSHHN